MHVSQIKTYGALKIKVSIHFSAQNLVAHLQADTKAHDAFAHVKCF